VSKFSWSWLLRVVFTTFIFLSSAHSAEQPVLDGSFWNKMTESQRKAYVMGIFEGLNYGHWEVRLDLLQEAKDHPLSGINPAALEDWVTTFAAKNYLKSKGSRITAAQVVSGITKLYADYRNQQIPIVSLVDVVTESIEGSSNQDIEKRLIEMRKEANKKTQ